MIYIDDSPVKKAFIKQNKKKRKTNATGKKCLYMNITHTAYNEAETVPLPTSPSEDKRQKCVDKEIGGQIDRWECTYRGGVQAIVWLNESE